jgi:hypothetical protein
MKQKQSKFYVVLAEAVHEGLRNISPSVPLVVLSYMNKKASVRSDNYIDDPEAFDEALKEIFGFGAKVIEKLILKALYGKLQSPKEVNHDFNFVEEVKNAQKFFDVRT